MWYIEKFAFLFLFGLSSLFMLLYVYICLIMVLCELFLLVMDRWTLCWKHFYWQNSCIYKICKENFFKEPILNITPIPGSWIKKCISRYFVDKLKTLITELRKTIFDITLIYKILQFCASVHFHTTRWHCFS